MNRTAQHAAIIRSNAARALRARMPVKDEFQMVRVLRAALTLAADCGHEVEKEKLPLLARRTAVEAFGTASEAESTSAADTTPGFSSTSRAVALVFFLRRLRLGLPLGRDQL